MLVLGESGTGKELAAQAIHQQSRRAGGPFVEINCAAIPRELAESELFGHVRGAFSGATRDRVGRFEAAAGGTLFLDEIGELPLDLQGKLLRVLQEGTFERVGEVRTRHSDVRIVAATNRNLLAEVEAGRFRQDLYYRLAVYPITMPALRERREDIPELAAQLLDRICRRLARAPVALSAEQVAWLAARDWPGNVRELLNVLERATISSADGALHLPIGDAPRGSRRAPRPRRRRRASRCRRWRARCSSRRDARAPPPPILGEHEMRHQERENLRRALESCGGKIYGRDGAAALLGLKPTTLASRLKRLQLRP